MHSARKSSVFAVLGLLLIFPVCVEAQFAFVTNNGTVTITGYTGPGGTVVIPAATNGLPITSIGNYAFAGNTLVNGVSMPGSLTNIGFYSFLDCSNLASVSIGTNVITIGAAAFQDCTSLQSITIPNSVTNLGGYGAAYGWVFAGCGSLRAVTLGNKISHIANDIFLWCYSLTNLIIPDSVTNIGYGAFYQSGLKTITLPRNVASLAKYAFGGCTNLSRMLFTGDAPVPADSTVFDQNSTTVYYLPGTSGWGTNFANMPSALWNPLPQTGGVQANQFGFNITGTAGIPIVVEACSDLANPVWTSLQSLTVTNSSVHFSDPLWSNYDSRFYRLRWP
jgi:hypothetical protein